jgi:hypothetical protein
MDNIKDGGTIFKFDILIVTMAQDPTKSYSESLFQRLLHFGELIQIQLCTNFIELISHVGKIDLFMWTFIQL